MKLFLPCYVQSCFSNKYSILRNVWTHHEPRQYSGKGSFVK